MGHVLRMPNDRLAKKVCLGWYRKEGRRTGKQNTLHNWRKLVLEAGLDPDNVEMHARDRNRWKNQIKIRMEQIKEWEERIARKHRDNDKEVEKITRNGKRKYGESFSSPGAKENYEEFCQGLPRGTCPYYHQILSISNMARHKEHCSQFNEAQTGHSCKVKLGDKREKKECGVCRKIIVKSNMARHFRIH